MRKTYINTYITVVVVVAVVVLVVVVTSLDTHIYIAVLLLSFFVCLTEKLLISLELNN